MSDLLRLILDSIGFLWPFRIVRTWERGGYYWFGRWWREVGAGVYPIIPWFSEIREISIVPAIVSTGRQDITLADGTLLSFTASATVRVVDLNLAVNSVDSFMETTQELLSAVLADRLARVKGDKLDPENRTALLRSLRDSVASEAATFGIEISKVRFTTFITNTPTLRLLQDSPQGLTW